MSHKALMRHYGTFTLWFASFWQQLLLLARCDSAVVVSWLERKSQVNTLVTWIIAIVLGCGLYGFSIGVWRGPLQGVFVGIKLPMLIFLTLACNGALNGMLAAAIGSRLSFQQTVEACLMSFALFALILGSLSPLAIGMALDAPKAGSPQAPEWHRMLIFTHTVWIAFAGVVANLKLLQVLEHYSGMKIGRRTLVAWLAGNLFVGAQFSYTLRPFFGDPRLPIQFFRDDPFNGTFYEAIGKIVVGFFK